MTLRSGIQTLSQPVQWDTGVAITAGNYEVGRNADGTNLLQLNVPTGASFEFSINDVAQLVFSDATLAFQQFSTISTTTGNLRLQPAGEIVFSGKAANDIASLRGTNDQAFVLHANNNANASTAQKFAITTLDTVGDARITVAYAEPTATETTPFWAVRGDITTPLTNTLDPSFLTFKWDPADDSVTVYVNDGGTIRSVAIGTVV